MTKANECTIIKRAVEILNNEGWIQGSYGGHKTGYCLIGALHTAAYDIDSNLYDGAYGKVAHFLTIDNNVTKQTLPRWNDAKGRTKEEVIAALEGACA